MAIKCCKDCVPPTRYLGCHDKCEKYIKEKNEWEMEKKQIRINKAKTPKITPYDFDEIIYASCKRHKRKHKR